VVRGVGASAKFDLGPQKKPLDRLIGGGSILGVGRRA
jgi:hypothetical protein